MDDLIKALLLWIAANSSYPTADLPPPAVVTMTPEALTAEAYAHVPEVRPADGVDERLFALYAFEQGPHGTIYVLECRATERSGPDGTGCDDPLFQERLLHELVHHVQYHSGVYARLPCRAAAEKEAYLLGGEYLAARRASDPLPNRNFWAHVYSRC